MKYGDNRLKKITRFLYKWTWCAWVHHKDKCWPRDPNGYWHCGKCHSCGEGIDFLTGDKTRGWS